MRWSEAQLDAVRARLNATCHNSSPVAQKRSKLRNQRVQWQGQWFDSKKELRDFQSLELQRSLSAIRAVIRQVSMPLPGSSRRIRVDFLVVENSGRLRWMDSKGWESETSKLKRAQLREAYNIEVELL